MSVLDNVLGKLAVRPLSEPRGPDVVHAIVVPESWLEQGDTIELDLPRNLTCAKCGGGGCDDCERAGALSLRGRQDPVQTLQISLPDRGTEGNYDGGKSIVLRIPEQGGFSTESALPRGLLMLRVTAGAKADLGVRRIASVDRASASSMPGPAREIRAPREVVLRSLVVGILLVLLFLWLLRLSGWL